MRMRLADGYEFDLGAAPLEGERTERALAALNSADGPDLPFAVSRNQFLAFVEAGTTTEVFSEVKRRATFADVKDLDKILRVVLGCNPAPEEEDATIPKNSGTPCAGNDGSGQG